MKIKFTPGPWLFAHNRDNMGRPRKNEPILGSIVGGEDWDIARIWSDQPQAEANGRLIAAAPTMYEELSKIKALIELDGGNHMRWDMVLEDINGILTSVENRP